MLLSGTALLSTTCADPLDLCTPKTANLQFFSKGDCMLTRATFFQGHEWLTWFGNLSLGEELRFSEDEIRIIAEGNRRVDWPKELLVHMNAGILQYAEAVEEFTDRPEHQRFHFLLTDTNTSPEAVAEARGEIRRLTILALDTWDTQRVKSLTQVGRAHHLIQDSFSEAHARRDGFHPDQPWCVTKVKAFIEREDGYDTPDIEYHGGSEDDSVGHTTTLDSIYREGRDCLEPITSADVTRCLSESAKRSIVASAAYLGLFRELLRLSAAGEQSNEQIVDQRLPDFLDAHIAMCKL